ncbi:hypothetical protein [Clostridium sp. DL1XJH146]
MKNNEIVNKQLELASQIEHLRKENEELKKVNSLIKHKIDVILKLTGEPTDSVVCDKMEKWETRAKAHNNIFVFLSQKGLDERDLNEFSSLLEKYMYQI